MLAKLILKYYTAVYESDSIYERKRHNSNVNDGTDITSEFLLKLLLIVLKSLFLEIISQLFDWTDLVMAWLIYEFVT